MWGYKLRAHQNITADEFGNDSNLIWMIAGYVSAVVSTCLLWQLCGLRYVSLFGDSLLKVIFDVSALGTFSAIGIYVGYYHSEKYFNPDKHLIEPQTSEWQILFLKLGTQKSREDLARKFLATSQKRSHRFWFEVLLSTTENIALNDDLARCDLVQTDLTNKEVKVVSREALKRISKTLRYQELEKWLPTYVLQAADEGNGLAKEFRRYLPMKTRFFQKKTAVSINK